MKEKKKYYAIKKGRAIEDYITTSWEECKEYVLGFNSIYKSFDTSKEAENYLKSWDKDKIKERLDTQKYYSNKKFKEKERMRKMRGLNLSEITKIVNKKYNENLKNEDIKKILEKLKINLEGENKNLCIKFKVGKDKYIIKYKEDVLNKIYEYLKPKEKQKRRIKLNINENGDESKMIKNKEEKEEPKKYNIKEVTNLINEKYNTNATYDTILRRIRELTGTYNMSKIDEKTISTLTSYIDEKIKENKEEIISLINKKYNARGVVSFYSSHNKSMPLFIVQSIINNLESKETEEEIDYTNLEDLDIYEDDEINEEDLRLEEEIKMQEKIQEEQEVEYFLSQDEEKQFKIISSKVDDLCDGYEDCIKSLQEELKEKDRTIKIYERKIEAYEEIDKIQTEEIKERVNLENFYDNTIKSYDEYIYNLETLIKNNSKEEKNTNIRNFITLKEILKLYNFRDFIDDNCVVQTSKKVRIYADFNDMNNWIEIGVCDLNDDFKIKTFKNYLNKEILDYFVLEMTVNKETGMLYIYLTNNSKDLL